MSQPFKPLLGDDDIEKKSLKEFYPIPSDENFSLPQNTYNLNLPPLKPYEYPEFQKNPTNKLQETRNAILNTLEMSHFYWDYPLPENMNYQNYYKFELPPTKFKDEGQINYINLPEYKFHSERERLNSTQLKEIWNNRTFKVPSEMENLPHLWNISKWLLHSSKERTIFLKKSLAACLRLFYAIPNVVNPCSERVIRVDLVESLVRPNIFNVFVNFVGFFLNLFDFFFGFKFRTLNSDYEYLAKENISIKVFWELCSKREILFQETFELSDNLQTFQNTIEMADRGQTIEQKNISKEKESEKVSIKAKLTEISSTFEKYFEEELKKELNKDDFEEDEIEIIRKSIRATKQEKLYEFVENLLKNNDSPKVLAYVLKKIKAFNIYKTLSFEKSEKIAKERKKLQEKLEEDRPIYSLIGYKRERLIDKWLCPITDSIEKEFETTLENELNSQNLTEEIKLFKNFKTYTENEKKLLDQEIKEMRKHCMQPVNKFTIKYPLFASQYRTVKENNYWNIIKEGSVTIHSDFMFYKVAKALASYFIKLYSLMFKILKWIWEGPFGVRCLCSCSEFYTDYSIGPYGELRKDRKNVRPVLRCFLGVIHGIQKSLKNFEEAPDDGFFGKNFGRILNILYCIFFRFLFAGIMVVLIIHPAINIICIVGGFIAAITTLIWLVFVEIFLLTWKLFIYDYKSTLRHHSWNYYDKKVAFYEHAHLKLLRSYKWFTLLHLAFDFFINVFFQLVMVIIMMVLSPLISIFVFVFGIALYVLKSMWDWFILNVIIRCFARVPSRNSTYAYRISGPGISRDFYNTLETNDLSLLVIAHLEKLELDQVWKVGSQIIEYPKKCLDGKCNLLFKRFMYDNTNNQFANDSFKNISFLKQSLQYYINEKKTHLPAIQGGHHTIRFTNEELGKNELLVEDILKDIVKEKNMDSYIWDLYDLRPGLYKRLTRKILQQILCSDAINPVEEIDHIERVKFTHNNTNFSNYISKFIDEENENYKKRKENNRAYLRKIGGNKQGEKEKVYVNINEIMSFYAYLPSYYQHPFNFGIVDSKRIKNWTQGKVIEMTEVELRL